MTSVFVTAVFLVASANVGSTESLQAASPPGIALRGVTVIDPSEGSAASARRANLTVVLAGGRITQVGLTGSVVVPEGFVVIDARGKYLVPGFWDMHVHFNRDSATAFGVMGPLMIAHGVTSVRDLQSDCWEPCSPRRKSLLQMVEWQRQIAAGLLLAPRLQALSGPIVHGPNGAFGYPRSFPEYWQPRTEEEGREVARYLAMRGVDVIKIYHTLSPEAFRGLVSEARRLAIPVTGHMPWSMDPIEVAQTGMRSIEHARWPVMACNPEHESFRTMYQLVATGEGTFDGDVFDSFKSAVTTTFDAERCAEIFRALVANDVYLVPTHLTREMDARAIEPDYRTDPRRRFVPAARLRGWDRDLSQTAAGPPDLLEFYRVVFARGLQVTGMAHAAGVKILVGTDAFDTMVFPGMSYHDELLLLRRAGLSPLAILRAATYEAAIFLGLEGTYGTVAPGKIADLILLDADPLLDIQNVERIHTVIFRGTIYDRDRLDLMIHAVEESVARGGS
ncbi:MAG: amidohydrolase family protein [Gemmatimonadetes bacterium]|nr:amidohydrolase family protein [Gemmatimonadota bacterium]